MKYHITWTSELTTKIARAVALYRTAQDDAASPEEVKTANKNLVAMAKSLSMPVAKLRCACEQHIASTSKAKQKGAKPAPEPKKRPAWAAPAFIKQDLYNGSDGLEVRVEGRHAKLYLRGKVIFTLDEGQHSALRRVNTEHPRSGAPAKS